MTPTIRNRLTGILVAGTIAVAAAASIRQSIEATRSRTRSPQRPADSRTSEVESRLKRLRSAAAAAPNDPDPHLALADALQRLGRARETADELAIVVKLKPNEPFARIGLGNARLAMM